MEKRFFALSVLVFLFIGMSVMYGQTPAPKIVKENLFQKGHIDFEKHFGFSYSEVEGHVIKVKKVPGYYSISFDETTGIIDNYYQATHGVVFSAYRNIYDQATGTYSFVPMDQRECGTAVNPKMCDPYVFAVKDSIDPAFRFSMSPPNTVNVGYDISGTHSQLLCCGSAIKITFSKMVSTVHIETDWRIQKSDQGKPIYDWPMMFAYDAAGNLVDKAEPYLCSDLTVSDGSGSIVTVYITVNTRWGGVEPFIIFDNLSWTTIEWVIEAYKILREANGRTIPDEKIKSIKQSGIIEKKQPGSTIKKEIQK